jgi:probable phosphoglycerate mutase
MEVARFRPPAGESFLDLQQRVVPVFEKEVDHAGGNILMVAHAGVNRMILCHLLGMPPEHLFRLVQDWGSMNLIDRQAGKYRIHCLNLRPAWSGVIQPDDDRRPCLPDSNYPPTI